jgi:uncharacterized membrane protein
VTRPRVLLGAAVLAFAVGLGSLAVLQHLAFWTGRFDLGNLVQAVWSSAHGNLLEVTNLRGEQMSRLGAHADPLVLALVPLWWMWPAPELLLVAQAVLVSLGAVPAFLLARRHLGSEWAALGFGLAYLLYPATQWLVLDDFHPVAIAAPLLLFAILALDADRLLAFSLFAGAACLTKEQVGLTVAALGVWYALSRRRPWAGGAIAAAGALVAIVAVTVVVPRFAPGGGSPFAGRYAEVGGSPAGIARTAARDPVAIAAAAGERRDGRYALDLLWPLAGLSLLSPLVLAAAPELAVNTLSSVATQTSVHFHYTATLVPVLVAAAILGAARLRRRWAVAGRIAPRAAVVFAVAGGVALGPLPVWQHVPGGSRVAASEHVRGRHAAAAERILARIPEDDPVSATNTLGAHLSTRKRVFSFPIRGEARWVAVDEHRPSTLDRAVDPDGFAVALRALRADDRFTLVAQDDGVLLFRRR